MNNFETVEFSIENSIATITLNRVGAGNSFNLQMAREFNRAVNLCYYNTDVRAVIINANGKLFCVGGDLAAMLNAGENVDSLLKDITEQCHAAFSNLQRMRAPVIVAVNGPAAGIGFSLSLVADIAIVSDKASFVMAYTAAGLSPDGGISYLLPKFIGARRAKELALTNRKLSANEALDWGLVNKVVAAEDLQQEAMELASRLAKGATNAIGSVKTLFLSGGAQSLETQMVLEAVELSKNARTVDGQEGIQAFVNKRRTTFIGE